MNEHERERVRKHKGCEHPYEADEPSGYVQWHYWAERHQKTHKHARCKKCGLWVICSRRSA